MPSTIPPRFPRFRAGDTYQGTHGQRISAMASDLIEQIAQGLSHGEFISYWERVPA